MESENKDNWSWFLVQIRDAVIDMERGIVVILVDRKVLQNHAARVTESVSSLLPSTLSQEPLEDDK